VSGEREDDAKTQSTIAGTASGGTASRLLTKAATWRSTGGRDVAIGEFLQGFSLALEPLTNKTLNPKIRGDRLRGWIFCGRELSGAFL
jgi:hypothetical protein